LFPFYFFEAVQLHILKRRERNEQVYRCGMFAERSMSFVSGRDCSTSTTLQLSNMLEFIPQKPTLYFWKIRIFLDIDVSAESSTSEKKKETKRITFQNFSALDDS
jgi:hypothetical protein